MDDLQCGEPVTQDGYETVANLLDVGRDRASCHCKVQIPVHVEVPVKVLTHQRFARVPRIEELIEETVDLR